MIAWPLFDLVITFIIGVPGSGKTSLAAKLAAHWKRMKRNYRPLVVYSQISSPKVMEKAIDAAVDQARRHRSRALFIVLDDMSFTLGTDRASREALNLLLRIRHLEPGIRWWNVVLIAHYVRGVPPALRAAHVKILTSIDPAWIPDLKSVFIESSLWDFWEAWSSWQKPGLALINKLGEHFIVKWSRVHKPRSKYWDIVINSNIETEMKEGEGRRRR